MEAAMAEFARQGYVCATVADICARAEANVASVNYHYGSKEKLYQEVWREAFARAHKRFPVDEGLCADAAPQERLRAFIRAKVFQMLESGEEDYFGMILTNEIGHPTECLDNMKCETILPMAERLRSIVIDILALPATDRRIELCMMSVLHQCLALGMMKSTAPKVLIQRLGGSGDFKFTAEQIDCIAKHIYEFSIGGIMRIKQELERSST
jgi:AcrR family transcriptional regulator